jgi:hypothetical protein
MRGFVASLLVAILVLAVALVAATFGALGVAAIGWLLHRWFDLTQWQGTLIAFGVTFGLGFVVYKLFAEPSNPTVWDENWDEEAEVEEVEEPQIVPWRRSRPKDTSSQSEKRSRT